MSDSSKVDIEILREGLIWLHARATPTTRAEFLKLLDRHRHTEILALAEILKAGDQLQRSGAVRKSKHV